MTAFQLETHLAYDGSWNRIQQPWDVDEPHSLVTMDSVSMQQFQDKL